MARAHPQRPKTGESLPSARNAEQPDLFGETRPSRLRAAARTRDPETSHKAARKAQRSISLKQLAVLDLFQSIEVRRSMMIDEAMIHEYKLARAAASDARGRDVRDRELYSAQDAHALLCEWYPKQSDSGLRSRRAELVRLGYLADSGIKGKTKLEGLSIEWELTRAGRALDVQAYRTTLENLAARRTQHRKKKRAGDLAP